MHFQFNTALFSNFPPDSIYSLNIEKCSTVAKVSPGFILKGYTCKLQAMCLGINKPLKNHITRQIDVWFIASNKNQKSRCCLVDLEWMKKPL
jgi:hypothetical protein